MQTVSAREHKPQTPDIGAPVAAPSATPPAKRSTRAFLILGLVVAAGLGVLTVHLVNTAGQENTDDAQIEADVVALAPRIGGFVDAVLVVDNQRVNKGDVLFKIDDRDLRSKLAQAQSELAVAQAQERAAMAQEQIIEAGAKGGLHSAKAALSSSQVNVHSADAQVQVARAALERAQVDARKATLDLARTKQLRASNAVTAEALDADQLDADSAAAALASAEAKLQSAQDDRLAANSRVAQAQGSLAASEPIDAQIAMAHAQTELARARVASAQASVELAQMQLSYATITAPEAGAVSKLTVRRGGLVSANQPIAELVPAHTYVVANFKETQIDRLRQGDSAEVEIDAYPHRTFHGKIESLSGGTGARFSLLPPDNASGNFVKVVQRVPVRIEWNPPPDVALRVGLSVDVTVQVSGS
jgi:membrane fusion protein (multidrug efflux system)